MKNVIENKDVYGAEIIESHDTERRGREGRKRDRKQIYVRLILI
jgi:hypothetical protein